MDFETKIREIASSLHKQNSKVMTPVTLSFAAAIVIYVVAVFHWLVPPPDPHVADLLARFKNAFHFAALLKILVLFVLISAVNVSLFELWVRGELRKAARVLAWDGKPGTLPEREITASILALLDFPHRFILRFITHWAIAAPVLVLCLLLLYSMPVLTIAQLCLGVVALLCLMAAFHFIVLKAAYYPHLNAALQKDPGFFKRPELARKRISYRRKVLIYLLVLVGSITWITTHLSLIGQEYSDAYQRDRYLSQRMASLGGFLEQSLFDNAGPTTYQFYARNFLVQESEQVYLLDEKGENLIAPEIKNEAGAVLERQKIPALHRCLISLLPGAPKLPPSSPIRGGGETSGPRRAGFFRQPLAMKITPRVAIVYQAGQKFIVSHDTLAGRWHLITIKPFEMDARQYLFQMGPVLAMFGVALVLSLLFARSMQYEVMTTLSRIIDSSARIENGDLSEPGPIMADDELGELAVHHLRMVDSIRKMVRQMSIGASQTEQATEQIRILTEEMADGSQTQSRAVEETSSIIAQMTQSLNNIAESVATLAISAEQSSAAILEMGATNEEVAANAEGLFSAVDETTASIQEMSASIRQVAANVRSTAAKTSEAASSMRELRAAVKEVAQIAEESSAVSREVMTDAESGAGAVQSTIAGINEIWESSRQAAGMIEALSRRIREIGRILTVIEDVTEETNLLALNAAIIAAQAGEQGRAFAVVADEIKELAERTQVSTAEIAEQIRAVQQDMASAVAAMGRGEESVSKGVLLSEEAGEALRKILASARRSMEMAGRISDSTQEQNRQTEHILSFSESIAVMIDQINTATQEQSKGSDQILMAAEKMRDIATQVRKATKEQAQGSRQISQTIEHVSHIAAYINNAQSEQKKAAQQVLAAITRIADIAHSNAASMASTLEAVARLQRLAEDFKKVIETFSRDLDRNANSSSPK